MTDFENILLIRVNTVSLDICDLIGAVSRCVVKKKGQLVKNEFNKIVFVLFISSILLNPTIDHICINLLVPSAQKINIENLGNQVYYWGGGGGGGLNHPINFFPILICWTQVTSN